SRAGYQGAKPIAPCRIPGGDSTNRPAGPRQGGAEGGPDGSSSHDPDDGWLVGA
ncbi:MAG: hypothetical protein HW391_1766, partial [Chloroflexi bacterium]|nr:hypothetical protein [Chloroflexota bacterium]